MLKDASIEFIADLHRNSEELFLAVDAEKNTLYINAGAKKLLKDIKNLEETEHLFSFDVCALDREKFIDCNPLREAMNSDVLFTAEIIFQIDSDLYKNLNLRSFPVGNKKILIMSDITEKIQNVSLRNTLKKNGKLIENLEKENKKISELAGKAETLAIRTGLTNNISREIRDSLDIEKIIRTALKEISETLGLSRGFYAEIVHDKNEPEFNGELNIKHSWSVTGNDLMTDKIFPDNDFIVKKAVKTRVSADGMIMINEKTDDIKAKLVTPVIFHNEIPGILVFIHSKNKQKFHPEEISLIEGIASQLASAVNRAKLFNELEKQKSDLEKVLSALKQAQLQLVQSEKMASLGQLVAGVAHEINTPIGAINSNNDIFNKCIKKIKQNPEDSEKFSSIMEDTIKINFEAIKRVNSILILSDKSSVLIFIVPLPSIL